MDTGSLYRPTGLCQPQRLHRATWGGDVKCTELVERARNENIRSLTIDATR